MSMYKREIMGTVIYESKDISLVQLESMAMRSKSTIKNTPTIISKCI